VIVAHAREFAKIQTDEGAQYRKHLHTYLNGSGWEKIKLPKNNSKEAADAAACYRVTWEDMDEASRFVYAGLPGIDPDA